MPDDLISKSALLDDIYNAKDRPKFYDGQDLADWMETCIKRAPVVNITEDDGK